MKNYCYLARHTIATAAFGPDNERNHGTSCRRTDNVIAIHYRCAWNLCDHRKFEFYSTDTAKCQHVLCTILVPTNLAGPVILDLKGFTLTSNGASVTASVGVGIGGGFVGPFVANAFPITVRNGSLNSFAVGIEASQAEPGPLLPPPLTNIAIRNMTFFLLQAPVANSTGIIFFEVDSSTIKNCIFNNCAFGISDILSAGGNQYTDLTFNNVDEVLVISPHAKTIVLDDCNFAAPAN